MTRPPTRVQIKGDGSSRTRSRPRAPVPRGCCASQWQPGDVPIAYPNATAANWPVSDMTEDKTTGIWSFTTPLPSGTFTYGFFRRLRDRRRDRLHVGVDPASPPWNDDWGERQAVEPTSQVYVPSDPAFGTVDYSWRSRRPRQAGRLVDVTYPTSQSTARWAATRWPSTPRPVTTRHARRPTRTLYLSHGGGGQEVDWSTQGAANSIFDHLIHRGKMQPTVIVMTDFNDISGGTAGYSTDVLQQRDPLRRGTPANVPPGTRTTAPSRALSAGAARANDLQRSTSPGLSRRRRHHEPGRRFPAAITSAQAAAMQSVLALQVGGGLQDPDPRQPHDRGIRAGRGWRPVHRRLHQRGSRVVHLAHPAPRLPHPDGLQGHDHHDHRQRDPRRRDGQG